MNRISEDPARRSWPRSVTRHVARAVETRARDWVTVAGFWLGVTLPLVYLPLLATGLQSQYASLGFLSLVVAHAFALLAGRDYRPENRD